MTGATAPIVPIGNPSQFAYFDGIDVDATAWLSERRQRRRL
jgi:hypothetical protein